MQKNKGIIFRNLSKNNHDFKTQSGVKLSLLCNKSPVITIILLSFLTFSKYS
jgi:hypothetical protein